ncbi:MAG: OmpH family outer membrane protein [Syntrophales bacterium]|nr:OmpH family outer membrane protein [Syntrophales bacterium]
MRKLSLALFFIFLLLPLSMAKAAQKDQSSIGPVKIGIVDIQRILRDSKAAKAARATFEKELEEKRTQVMNKEKAIKNLEEEINKLDPRKEEAQRNEKIKALKQAQRELTYLKQDVDEELRRRDMELSRKLLEEIVTIVRDFARNEKFTAIFERSAIVTANEAIDITDRIIKIYDSRKR